MSGEANPAGGVAKHPGLCRAPSGICPYIGICNTNRYGCHGNLSIRTPDDIVEDVTTAFSEDVKRILSDPTNSRWIDQSRIHDAETGVRGDCARAAIASLFGLPLNAVPDFDASDAMAFYDGIEAFFLSLGYELYRVDRNVCFDALHLASGPSPRGVKHMVVRQGDKIVHDPHPSRAGLLTVEHVTVPIPMDPAASPSLPSGERG